MFITPKWNLVIKLNHVNPFQSAHIPCAQAAGILPYFTPLQKMNDNYLQIYAMYYHQTSHGQCGHPRLSYNSKESVTFDLISRSCDPIWPPTTFCNPNFTLLYYAQFEDILPGNRDTWVKSE